MSSDRISDQRLLELVDIFSDHQQGALRLDSDTSLALRELIRLRAENERLTKDLAHWKDCHGVTADKLAEAESQLAALRRPVAQSENVEAIRAYYLNGRTENWHQSGEHVQTLLSALDQAQRERQQLIANHESREDQMEAEIARLSSPPEYRADMKMPALLTASFHQSEWCLFTTAGDVVELVEDDEYCSYAESKAMRDTLLGDWASWRNSLGVSQDALSERNRECVELRGKLERAEHEACAQSQHIERLEGALRQIQSEGTKTQTRRVGDMYSDDGWEQYEVVTHAAQIAADALAAADGPALTASRQHTPTPSRSALRDLVDRVWNEATESEQVPHTGWADRIIEKWMVESASQQHKAGSGDGVAGD